MSTQNQNRRRIPSITLENAKLIYRNFSGVAKRFNDKGDRNFNIVLDKATADMLYADGWNVKVKPPREEGEDPQILLKVTVRWDKFPPRIVLVTKNGKTILDEESSEILDWAEIKSVDLVIAPYRWTQPDGKTGITAYLSRMFVNLSENDLEYKHSDISSKKRNAEEDED